MGSAIHNRATFVFCDDSVNFAEFKEKNTLFIGVEPYHPFCDDAGRKAVPANAWLKDITGDYIAKAVPLKLTKVKMDITRTTQVH